MQTDVLDRTKRKIDTNRREKGHGQGPPPVKIDDNFDPGNGSNGWPSKPVLNAYVAMMLFIAADVMLFAGLIGAFVVFRFGAENWPPPGQPRLPLGVTSINTLILLVSGFLMIHTWRILTNRNQQRILKGLALTAIFGSIFLVVQGYEWLRLIDFGLKLSTGVFGATFYTLIGCHAIHVTSAVIWLVVVTLKYKAAPQKTELNDFLSIKLIGMYWFVVVALWPLIYGLVYLS